MGTVGYKNPFFLDKCEYTRVYTSTSVSTLELVKHSVKKFIDSWNLLGSFVSSQTKRIDMLDKDLLSSLDFSLQFQLDVLEDTLSRDARRVLQFMHHVDKVKAEGEGYLVTLSSSLDEVQQGHKGLMSTFEKTSWTVSNSVKIFEVHA